jgi:hypothetical protein
MSAKVYTTVDGLEIRIGNHGLATFTTPAIVPDEVAEQLDAEIKGDRPDPEKPGHAGRPGRSDIRVERDASPTRSRRQPAAEPVKGE